MAECVSMHGMHPGKQTRHAQQDSTLQVCKQAVAMSGMAKTMLCEACHTTHLSASLVKPRWRSIMQPDRVSAVGLALFWPARSGAVPCTASARHSPFRPVVRMTEVMGTGGQ